MGLHGTSLEQSIGLPHNHDNRWVGPDAEEDPDIKKVGLAPPLDRHCVRVHLLGDRRLPAPRRRARNCRTLLFSVGGVPYLKGRSSYY